MIIDLERIPKEGLHVDRYFELENGELVEEEAILLEPLHAQIDLCKQGQEISIKGKITTVISFICSRCLAPFEFKVDAEFDLVFLPEELFELKEELSDDDLDLFFYFQNQINLREIVLEQLNLTFPMKPLCSPDCQGICPVCGQIISEGNCHCQQNLTDPRLEKLKTFLKR
ncbi:MAG: hypothetical protein B5M54_01690 [Candidatus Aminicenantes bacterium 4484_214]|nr:MAG: hypothetical protein B5M54_01690 [Candidatus Aminicenantes bacterium 4484_214]RLE05526.1 MAG: hypothetical protein DRJ06_08920 [Candidatus Aminicenantes bacterium]HDJ23054.1 DUF177 domain-containing protein [Candidatus Aminicenantes bacterium]